MQALHRYLSVIEYVTTPKYPRMSQNPSVPLLYWIVYFVSYYYGCDVP